MNIDMLETLAFAISAVTKEADGFYLVVIPTNNKDWDEGIVVPTTSDDLVVNDSYLMASPELEKDWLQNAIEILSGVKNSS